MNGGSCGTGAAGAFAGEITAALYFTEERQVAFGSEERAKVDTLVDGRIYEREDVEAAVEAWRQQGVNLAQLAAGLTALAAGAESAGDISGAAAASDNAVENNVCGSGLCVAAALWAAGAAWTAYDTYTTYQEEGGAAAVQQLVTDGVITLVAGPGKAAYKVGDKIYDSGYQAWKAARAGGERVPKVVPGRANPWTGVDTGNRGVGAEQNPNIAGWIKGPDGSATSIRKNADGLPDWENFLKDNASVTSVSGSLDPKSIRFTQNNIGAKFKDGSSVGDLVKGLKNGSIDPDSLPPIRTFDVNGQLYSLDNRRLYAYQQAGVKIPTSPATASEIAKDSQFKFSTTNGGRDIEVRGQ